MITCKDLTKVLMKIMLIKRKLLTINANVALNVILLYELSDESEIIKNIDNSKKYKTPDNVDNDEEDNKEKVNKVFYLFL